jgi:chitin synthase
VALREHSYAGNQYNSAIWLSRILGSTIHLGTRQQAKGVCSRSGSKTLNLHDLRAAYTYYASFLYFAVVQVYVLILSFYLVAHAFIGGSLDFNLNDGVGAFLKSFFSSASAGIVVIALASTYGIYFVTSLLYMDPWHMLTSIWAYAAGLTSSINILMVYAFCNWNDVSWGTKGSDKADSLPSAQTKKQGKDSGPFIEEANKTQSDIDSQFARTVKLALSPFVQEPPNDEKSLDDSYKAFRTKLIVLWTFSNALLCICITSESIDKIAFTVSVVFFWSFTNIIIVFR